MDDAKNAPGNIAAGRSPGPAIDSLLHPMMLLVRRMFDREGREEEKLILIDDEENILEALRAGLKLHSVYVTSGRQFPAGLPSDVPLHEVSVRASKKLFGNEKLSRLFALAHTPRRIDLEALAAIHGDIVALENLSISGNIGAIVRTSLALGAGALVLLNADPGDVYDRRLIRASRGYVFSIPIVTATIEELARLCAQHQLELMVTGNAAGTPVSEIAAVRHRLVIAFGSEKDGCSPELQALASGAVYIPIRAEVESLNVSAAAAIVLSHRYGFNSAPETAS